MTPRNDDRADKGDLDDSSPELPRIRREVNEELVLASLRAHDAADAAEGRARDLVAMAELRETLLGVLGHDLRSPLSAMMVGVGVLIARGHLTEEDAIVATRILISGNRMTRMISQILDFTRSRMGGGLQLERRPTHLGALCRGVAEELELATSVPVRCTEAGDLAGSWDPDRLTQVLSNIVGNGTEHAASDTSVVMHAYAAGPEVVVEISNQGRPIPPDLLPLIFEPFRRAEKSGYSKATNLGLGLYIAREVVLAHGGTLAAHSADGATTFTMRLPRASATST